MWWRKPSNDRDWREDYALLPYAEREGDFVHVKNIRNCRYESEEEIDVRHYDKTYDLRKLKQLWFANIPFSRFLAHALVSFEFEGGEFLAISVELRKKHGDDFSMTKGLLNMMELAYVVGDERDLIKLRTNYRVEEHVYLYPIQAPTSFVRGFFLNMLERANRLREKPEFYNTLKSSCADSLRRHANAVAPESVPRGFAVLLPLRADRFLQRLGYIDDSEPIEVLRKRHYVNERAKRWGDDPDFSRKIRSTDA